MLSAAAHLRAQSDVRDDWVVVLAGDAQGRSDYVKALEQQIADTVAAHPQLEGRQVMFVTHLDTTDLSVVRFYSANDTRVKFFEDLGLAMPQSVIEASQPGQFAGEISAEQIDQFDDVELIVTYGGEELIAALEADPLTSKMPAVQSGAVVTLANDPLGTAANPTPLSISWVLEDYVEMLANAVDKLD